MDEDFSVARRHVIERAEHALLHGRINRRDFMRAALAVGVGVGAAAELAGFAERARANQVLNITNLRKHYDYIVCGSGSSGSVVARRLAENPSAKVLLLEAGGSDDVPSVTNPSAWFTNLGSARDWGFQGEPNPHLNNRRIPLSMGKVLGGGSSINVMVWSRGHKNDWNYFAAESGEASWNYDSVLAIYRGIEDWQGEPDAKRRGRGGLVYVQPSPNPNPIAPAMLEAANRIGIPTFADQNGSMMEGEGGAAIANVRIRDGQRQSIFRTYAYPLLDRPNLTVLTGATVSRLKFKGSRVVGVEFVHDGKLVEIEANETILSTGAINTPKILMQSGIGNAKELQSFGIDVVQHLPGVGQNFQDHFMIAGCVWEYAQPIVFRNNAAEATFFWKSDPSLDTPDLQPFQIEVPYTSAETQKRYAPPLASWSISPAVVRPKSRGEIKLSGPAASDPVRIFANTLSEPDDMKAILRCIELCREIGNSAQLRPFAKREVMPRGIPETELQDFVREAAVTYWHQSCTAKMGRDPMSVVDGHLKVHGVEGLRVADASIMPRVTTGNTMAPCVIIGEQAARFMKQ
jgi:choline dehydrogenase